MSHLVRYILSTRIMAALLILMASAMAVATFVESEYDTATAKALIYNAKWFEILMLWLVIIFISNIKTYKLTQRHKWPVLLFHLAFIFMFIGGAITRYYGFEGQMPIQEGELSNQIISDQTYLKIRISDSTRSVTNDKNAYTMSYLNQKNAVWPLKKAFEYDYSFGQKSVKIKSIDYIPNAKDSIRIKASGKKFLKIVSSGQQGQNINYIESGQIANIEVVLFSFNKPTPGTIQLTEKNDSLLINSPYSGQYLSMKGQLAGFISDTTLLKQNMGELKANNTTPIIYRTLYSINNSNFVIPKPSINGEIVYYQGDKSNMEDRTLLSVLALELSSGKEKDTLIIKGGKGITTFSAETHLNGLSISAGYGSNIIKSPFSIRCDDFKLDRYPGSNNASSYESKVTVIDRGKETQHKIYMNNVLNYSGYRFFQASYFPDESGTILSVNKDLWGTRITYAGYFFMLLSMLLILFRKKTNFWKLNQKLKTIKKKLSTAITLLFLFLASNSQSSLGPKETISAGHKNDEAGLAFSQPQQQFVNTINIQHANKFGHLLVQDFQGRIKPMDTQALELLRKIYKRDRYLNLSPEQWFLSIQIDPAYWLDQMLIFVGEKGGEKLAKETGANTNGYTSFSNLLDGNTGQFKLQNQYRASFSKKKSEQSNYDKELIRVTERYNILENIVYGYFTRVIPVKNDTSNAWTSWITASTSDRITIDSNAYALLSLYFNDVKLGMETGIWEKADKSLDRISRLQRKWGKDIIPSESKVDLEIIYNHVNIFFYLMILYSLLGISMIVLGFTEVLSSNSKFRSKLNKVTKVLIGIMLFALAIQILALGVRWYLSGHAPWSNGYEAIVFISAISVFSGIALYKNSNALIPAAGAIVATIMMGFAHGGSMLDPQITPLEPVLKSYWLMVHVSIITSSYGFFGLSALISTICLTMFCIKPKGKIRTSIEELTIVNEMAMQIGAFALTGGTFLGAIWANESWGRYWSWDPKETWAFISLLSYALILHFRIIPGMRGNWTFNIAGMWTIWTIIFTYFGVNYYLTGLHSYAAGDRMPVPTWIPVSITVMTAISLFSYFNFRKFYRTT